jgi:hypothetical protein
MESGLDDLLTLLTDHYCQFYYQFMDGETISEFGHVYHERNGQFTLSGKWIDRGILVAIEDRDKTPIVRWIVKP